MFLRRGARQQQHQVRMLGARGPDLLAVHDVAVVAVLAGGGAQRKGIGAAGRLGHAERLQAQGAGGDAGRSEEHTSELQSLMRISYAVSCLKKNKTQPTHNTHHGLMYTVQYT